MRILIVDDHVCIMRGIARLFEDSGYFRFVGMSKSGEEALSFMQSNVVDLVLLDIELSEGENGFDLIKKIKKYSNAIKVVIFSTHNNYIYRNKAKEMGADDYIAKGCDYEDLERRLRNVYSGKTEKTKNSLSSTRYNVLSKKEEYVVSCLSSGMAEKNIADDLNVKPSTVATYVQRAKQKLGVFSIAELIAVAGLLSSEISR